MPTISAYLPDDVHKAAKLAGLPFSQLLREAVEQELELRRLAAAIRDGIPADKPTSKETAQ